MGTLKKFSTSEIFLSQDDAWRVLKFFFDGDLTLTPGALTENDRSFAQALLIEAIDASAAMGFIESLFTSAMKPNPEVKDIIKSLVKQALKQWWSHATGSDLKDPKIYKSIRDELRRNWRSAWQIRELTGSNVY